MIKSFFMQQFFRCSLLILIVFCAAACSKEAPKSDIDYDESMYGYLIIEDSIIAPVPQTVQERIIVDRPTEIVRKFGMSDEDADSGLPPVNLLSNPRQAVVDASEKHLYILDHGVMDVKQFDIDTGQLVQRYGKGKGSGPGEFLDLGLIALVGEGQILVTDKKKRDLTLFDLEGQVQRVKKMPFHTRGLATSQDGRYVLLTNRSNNLDLFKMYTAQGEELVSFGWLASGDDKPYISFPGEMLGNNSDSFVFSGLYGGGLLSYSFEGAFRFYRETLDSAPFPRWVADNTEDAPVYKLDASLSNATHIQRNIWENVYYEVVLYQEEGQTWFIDAYDMETGDYIASTVLPEECGAYFITDRHVYANCKEGFVQFLRGRPDLN